MVYLAKVDNEVIAIDAGSVRRVLSSYEGRDIDYTAMKESLKQNRIDGGDAPRMSAPDNLGYIDFDLMEEKGLREPVPVGGHRDFSMTSYDPR